MITVVCLSLLHLLMYLILVLSSLSLFFPSISLLLGYFFSLVSIQIYCSLALLFNTFRELLKLLSFTVFLNFYTNSFIIFDPCSNFFNSTTFTDLSFLFLNSCFRSVRKTSIFQIFHDDLPYIY